MLAPPQERAYCWEVLGKYHPHGDASSMTPCAYGAGLLHALSLVDGQGNFGSIDNDRRRLCVTLKPAYLKLR